MLLEKMKTRIKWPENLACVVSCNTNKQNLCTNVFEGGTLISLC